MVDCREGRDCEHGRQIGKCGDCEYQELLGELSYIRSERDALKAELDAARKQAPVGYFYLLDFSDTTIYKDKEGDENYAPLYASPVPAQKGTPAYSCVYCGCLELEKVTACHCLPQGAEQKWNEHMVFPALD